MSPSPIKDAAEHLRAEWLETDGLGGFASGCVNGLRSRRYHGLYIPALTPPTGRMVMVAGAEAELVTKHGAHHLLPQAYREGFIAGGDAVRSLVSFTCDPWPTWRYRLVGDRLVRFEFFLCHGSGEAVLAWHLEDDAGSALLHVRPFLAMRDYHGLQRENGSFNGRALMDGSRLVWRPYDGVPKLFALSNGLYTAGTVWHRGFHYGEESDRGLDDAEDLPVAGMLTFDLAEAPAVLVFKAEGQPGLELPMADTLEWYDAARSHEAHRRGQFASPLHRAADAYLARRGNGLTVIAGYPWFTDWGRDTFIAVRGLCLATGRIREALAILDEWSLHVSEGMLPNRFPDAGESPQFNSVDASLWYIIACGEALELGVGCLGEDQRQRLITACQQILEGYAAGTRHGIAMDSHDHLLRCGEPGVQLTWMDAKVGDWVVTPRIGKPVEVQALWVNALVFGATWDARWAAVRDRAIESFNARFWNAETNCLFDVVDQDHIDGSNDPCIRPNQIFAAGGLPVCLLPPARARAVVDVVASRLWTPAGLRSLDPADPAYRPHYHGGVHDRDGAYHQGTVWPWLAGAFTEAWVRSCGSTPQAVAEARERFLEPLVGRSGVGGHVAEIADGDAPHRPRGCPFQAWSVGELLRVRESILENQSCVSPCP